MARLKGHRALDFEQLLYVRRPSLKWGDRVFKRGELFPWREMKILPRKIHQLWMQRRLGHERLGEPRQGAEPPLPAVIKTPAAGIEHAAPVSIAPAPLPPEEINHVPEAPKPEPEPLPEPAPRREMPRPQPPLFQRRKR